MISFVFDVVIAILLVVTIAFCVLLGKRLKRLRADEEMMRAVVADIVQSTGKAEHAIRTLKSTAEECENTLGVQLRDAELAIHDLTSGKAEAETTARRLAEMVAIVKSLKLLEKASVGEPLRPANEPIASVATAMTDMPAEEPMPVEAAVSQPQRAVSALEALRARAA
ncbi:MAG: hypothetical protein KDJ77_15135 [Rhodobiaceae bacterium]|nr:hypothetical protein [Rhodobiaceae bacterium]